MSQNRIKTKTASNTIRDGFLKFCDLGEARTLDPLIKSQLLYRLSYQVVPVFCRDANIQSIAVTANVFLFSVLKLLVW